MRAHIAVEDAQIAELKRQVAADSRNSSKPPSSDGLAKPDPKSLRKKSGRKPGGQPGRRGRTLEQVSDPDEVIRHEPTCCGGCGAGARKGVEVGVRRRQVFDLPPIRIRVTEHQIQRRPSYARGVDAGPDCVRRKLPLQLSCPSSWPSSWGPAAAGANASCRCVHPLEISHRRVLERPFGCSLE